MKQSDWKKLNRILHALNEIDLASEEDWLLYYDLNPARDAIRKGCARLKRRLLDAQKN